MPRALRRGVARVLKLLRGTAAEKWGHLLDYTDFAEYYMRTSIWHPWLYRSLHTEPRGGARLVQIGRDVAARLPHADLNMLMGAMDLQSYLVDDILTKVDRATMSVALEARVPILDHCVVQMAARMPYSIKTAGGEKKHVLKALLERHVPRALWDRPKRGFGVPLVVWLRTSLRDWAYDVLTSRKSDVREWVNETEVRRMLDDHVSSRRNSAELIWACLQLAGWDARVRRIRDGIPALTVDGASAGFSLLRESGLK
jgi:asparagine synthase (glutamine-hydrolysing)